MKLTTLFATVLILGLSADRAATADLVINISGTVGSSLVNWNATGSITAVATVAKTSSVGAAPDGGTWETGFDNNIGDLFQPAAVTQNNLALSGGGIDYKINGTSFATLDTVDLTQSALAGQDDFQPDPTSSTNYLALNVNDVVSWTGSGTFTLGGGATYDSYFIGGATGTSAIDGGNYVVNIAMAVPEPGTFGMFGLVCLVGLAKRRRKFIP